MSRGGERGGERGGRGREGGGKRKGENQCTCKNLGKQVYLCDDLHAISHQVTRVKSDTKLPNHGDVGSSL